MDLFFLIIQNSFSCCTKNVCNGRNIEGFFTRFFFSLFFLFPRFLLFEQVAKYWLGNLIFIERMFLGQLLITENMLIVISWLSWKIFARRINKRKLFDFRQKNVLIYSTSCISSQLFPLSCSIMEHVWAKILE